jgi:DNA repair exonuclease SbcCD ATPase subunit
LERLQTRLADNLEQFAQARNAASQTPNADNALSVLQTYVSDLPANTQNRRQQIGELVATLRLRAAVVADLRPRLVALTNESLAIENDGVAKAITMLDSQIEAIQADIVNTQVELEHATARFATAQSESLQLAHLALLVEHGEAYGLDDGHCPLCAAARTDALFAAAIAESKQRLSDAGNKVAEASNVASQFNQKLAEQQQQLQQLQQQRANLSNRIARAEKERETLAAILKENGCQLEPTDIIAIDRWLLDAQERQIRIQDALVVLDSADATDRIGALEKSIDELRGHIDSLSGEIIGREIEANLAKKVEDLTKEFPNEILAEQFDAVMPLLKEFYRRLRPHADWDEIEYDFGGRVRGSLNFYVADRKNPQFLFSSGQRRATGLAFLLAVHLARHWAKLPTLILDDPVQHIDDYRALNLVEVLAAIRRTGHQIIVSVEDPALARLLSRRLRVTQDQHGCYYELGTANTGSTCVIENHILPALPSAMLHQAQAS